MLDLVAIAQSSPGAIAVNGAIIVGYKLAGIPGMLVSVIGAIIPPMVILSVISVFYDAFCSNYYIAALLKGMTAGEYNYKHNSVGYDHEKGLYYWRTSVPGNIGVTPSRFYVRFDRNDVDTVRVLFKFTSGAAVGGDGIEVSVREMYYNDRLIIKNSDYSREEGIVIMKR